MTMNRWALPLAFALSAASGCTAVLGLEEAKLDETDQALVCALPDQRPVERCATTDDCERCLRDECGGSEQIQSCEEDSACRSALVNHRICVRDGCEDETGSCGECLGQTPGAECLAACADSCKGSELVPLCDLFCACMDAKCPGKQSDCLESCRETPDFKLECLISHCELANDPDSLHCLHATQEVPACRDQAPEPMAACPASQHLKGYGCKKNGDCCSGLCMPNSLDDPTGTCE
jgi:hypothetical protein